MLTIRYQTAFKKDYKRIVRRGYDVRLLEEVITILAEQRPLPEIYRDHNLSGDYIGCRECHITPDWLLIYEIKNDELVLYGNIEKATARCLRVKFMWFTLEQNYS